MNSRVINYIKSNETGQTAVEYILMLAVMAALITSIMGILRDRILAGADNCGTSTSLACSLQRITNFGSNPGDTENNFRYFTLRR